MDQSRPYWQHPGPVASAAIALPLLDILLLLLRFYTRRNQKQGLKWDDWLLIPATLLTIGFGIAMLYGVTEQAVGYPVRIPPDYTGEWLDLQTDQITLSWLVQWAASMLISVALALIKASFILFYIRIFSIGRKHLTNVLLLLLLAISCAWGVAFFFASLFDCGSNFWANYGSARTIQNNCTDTMTMLLAHSISGFILDVIIIIAPIPLVWQLQLSRGKKFAISAVFLLGAVAVAASLVRVVMMVQVSLNAFRGTSDGLLAATEFLYWSLVECGVGIAAACLPTLQQLFRKWSWASIVSSARGLYGSRSTRTQHESYSTQSLNINSGSYDMSDVNYSSNLARSREMHC